MNNGKKHITIYEVAQALGVSTATVSRALSDHHSIGKETKKKVKKMALQMGYAPNAIASSLRSKQTNTIGVIVSNIDRTFISALISGIEEVASKYNYNVIISQSLDSYAKEIEDVKTMFNSRVDGLIVSLAMETKNYNHFKPYLKMNYPLVFADRVAYEIDADKVLIDNYNAAFEATNHLIEQGYRRIGHLAGEQHRYIYQKRYEGYLDALKKKDLEANENLIYYSRLNLEDGRIAAKSLLSKEIKPDAIFAANDTSAVGFMQQAENMGFLVPEDIGIVGFNNDPITTIVKPQLTTIDHPAKEIGRKAAEMVLDKVSGKSQTTVTQTITFETKLIVRRSSLKKNT